MGGNALKIVKTRRYSKKEYEKILLEVGSILTTMDVVFNIPESYGAKESFGNLDVLILSESLKNNILSIIKDKYSPNEIHHNGNVYSFDYKEFQIDFIVVGEENWGTSYHYFSYNDVSMLIGRIAHQMGFRYGHYGLKLVYRHEDGGRKFSKIISKDMFDTLRFLGFDTDRYTEGFYNLTDIFEYVVDSKYFNPKIFQYEMLNRQNKTRNKKRVNYAGFLEFVDKYDFKDRNFYEYQDKDYYVKKAEDYFGIDIINQIKTWKEIVEKDKMVSAKFNGKITMERYPDLKGKELGSSIIKFKNYIKSFLKTKADEQNEVFEPDFLFKEWIIESNVEHIFSHFSNINNLKKTAE